MNQNKIVQMLQKIAIASESVGNARIASALVCRNEIVSVGINKRKSHPLQAKYSRNEQAIMVHGELDAIINALRDRRLVDIERSTMYVVRVKRDGSLALARPCSGCQRAIVAFGIRSVRYTCDNGDLVML